MIIKPGEQVHVVYRSLYESSTRRHFVGTIAEAEGALCRVDGYAFIYDARKTEFVKKSGKRTTIIDLAESGYVVNIIDSTINLDDIHYRYASGEGLIATDGKDFVLNINEFNAKS